jgi:catechol 2,3-dioxygenase-like lactoylglutathione lyase family enzyme
MPALRLDHVALPMYDPRATRAFYEDVLGLALSDALSGDDWEGRAWLMLVFADADGRHLSLCGFRGARERLDGPWPQDARHYAFAAADAGALDDCRRRLKSAGVAWREENHGEQSSIYFNDPSGTVLEITAPPTPARAVGSGDPEAVLRAFLDADA